MDFLHFTDIDGSVHLVNPAQIVNISPATVIAGANSQLVLTSGSVIYLPTDLPTLVTNIPVAIPTITINLLTY
jgi:hypothetical protein